ncbi:glycerate kinase [Lactobacillus porci]|uniref:glycerate kinase family protein n=1 Tax=Lactobacillus porci TaxID=2012477 RepID=UPI003996C88E
MKFVLAPDSFKESMTAKEVCQAMARGIRKVFPESEIVEVPMADGGEGTVDALVDANQGEKRLVTVLGPDGRKRVKAVYGLINHGKTAVIETAQASGLELLASEERDPRITTTYGTGQVIKDALDHGAEKLIIGLGGSATNDGGAGMAQALGVRLLDQAGQELPFGGMALAKLAKIDIRGLDPRLQKVQVVLASDVTNPLTGENGASRVFGRQKGATPAMIAELDASLVHYAAMIRQFLKKDVENLPGAGAAGGLGAGLMAFTDCTTQPGAKIVIAENHLEQKIAGADFVFTGEGGTDFQTKFGKTPYAVAQVARKHGIPVYTVAGSLGEGIESLYHDGFSAIFGILDTACSLPEALKHGPANVERTCENIARVIKSVK